MSSTEQRKLRSFGTLLCAIFALIGVWSRVVHGEPVRLWAIAIAAILGLAALIEPSSLRLFYQVWMKFGQGLGWINNRILLGLVFYLVLTPIGLIRKLTARDPLNLRFEKDLESYRVEKKPRPSDHMLKQF